MAGWVGGRRGMMRLDGNWGVGGVSVTYLFWGSVAGGGEWGGWTFIRVLLHGHNMSLDHRPLQSVAQIHGAAAVVVEVSSWVSRC